MQRPNAAMQMTTACRLYTPETYYVNGTPQKKWPNSDTVFFANIKSYGGTERVTNDTLQIEDTVVLTTWYRPDIKAGCRVRILRGGIEKAGDSYEIINEPENWEMRNQFLVCKMRRVIGRG